MRASDVRAAMLRGVTRFRHARSGREFSLDPKQAMLLEGADADEALLIGYPVERHPRKRGRAWSWLSPANLEVASDAAQGGKAR